MELTEAVIDVSEHQGDIDFAVCYGAGVRNAIPRAGIGGRLDNKFTRNVDGFRSVGIDVPAAYWFINPKSSYTPEEQAAIAIDALHRYGIRTLMLDCEWYTNEGGPNPPVAGYDYNAWIWRFINNMDDVRPIIYTSPSFWNSWGGSGSDFGSLDTIIASYKWQGKTNDPIAQGVSPDRWGEVVLAKSQPGLPIGWDTTLEGWQFSAGLNKQGPVYGMQSTDLDLNVVNLAALNRWKGRTLDPTTVLETDMPIYRFVPELGYVAEISMGHKVWVTGDYFYGVVGGQLQGSGVQSTVGIYATPAPLDKINAIPDPPGVPGSVPAIVDVNAIAEAVRQKFKDDPQR